MLRGSGLAALRHESGSRSFTYYSALAIQDRFRDYEHTGTVFGAINKQQFESLTVIEPDDHLVAAFDDLVCRQMLKLELMCPFRSWRLRHATRCCQR